MNKQLFLGALLGTLISSTVLVLPGVSHGAKVAATSVFSGVIARLRQHGITINASDIMSCKAISEKTVLIILKNDTYLIYNLQTGERLQLVLV